MKSAGPHGGRFLLSRVLAVSKPRAREHSRTNHAAPESQSKDEAVAVTLEHARWRHFGWSMFSLVLGGLLMLELGTVGRFIGLCIAILGVFRGYRFVRTLLHPAGTIRVSPEHVDLPVGLCRGKDERVAMDEIRHVFFLRRSVPWFSSNPILVIEAGDSAHLYPRAWFDSELAQRRVAQAIREVVAKQRARKR